jgi:hypothetical protein
MMPKNANTKGPTKGQEIPLPVTSTAIDEIPVAISMAAPDGFLGTREDPNGVHVAKSAAHDEDDSTRLTNNDDDTKRKASIIHLMTKTTSSQQRIELLLHQTVYLARVLA